MMKLLLKRIIDHHLDRTISETIFTGFAGQIAVIISGIFVARALGVDNRGHLALLIIFPTILSQIGNMGMPQAIIYFSARNQRQAAAIARHLWRLFFIQIMFLLHLHTILLDIYLVDEAIPVQLAGYVTLGVIPGMLAQQYGMALLQGIGRFKVFNIQRLLVPGLYVSIIASMYVLGIANLPNVVLGWVVANVSGGFVALYVGIRNLATGTLSGENVPTLRQMLGFGLKGLLGSVTPLETFRLDQLVAGLLLSPTALGLYVVGQAFMNLPRFLASSVGLVAYPTIASQRGNSLPNLLIWRFFRTVALPNVVLSGLLILGMPLLLPFLFGPEFSDAVPLAQILMVGASFAGSRRILVEGLRGFGLPQASTFAEFSMYPWLLLGIPVLMLWYDIAGLAIAITIGYVLSLVVAMTFSIRSAGKDEATNPA